MTYRWIALVVLALLLVPATTGPQLIDAGPSLAPGQTATLLPDGRWLLLGGEGRSGPVADAATWDPRTQASVPLAAGLHTARAWYTATVLPDGRVLIVGGAGADGRALRAVERFDPATERFETLPGAGLAARARHTATLLTDGRLLVAGGVGADGAVQAGGELWEPRTGSASAAATLATPRAGHEAVLLPEGTVLLWGGAEANGLVLHDGEIYDPAQGQVIPVTTRPAGTDLLPEAPRLVASIPADGASGVPTEEVVLALRFSKPLRVETVTPATVLLSGPAGLEPVSVVPAEGGRLAFVTPTAALTPGSHYTLSLNGPVDTMGFLLAPVAVQFTTAGVAGSRSPSAPSSPSAGDGASAGADVHVHEDPVTPIGAPVELDDHEWRGERRDGKPYSPWQELPALQAPAGVTALAGQVLRLTGQPLAGVTLTIGGATARSDHTGRFLLAGVQAGRLELLMDGTTASQPGRTYGMFEVGVDVEAGRTTVLPYTIWLPLIDTQHAVALPVPTAHEIVVTTPRVPGLELRIPAGVYLRSRHTGRPLRWVSLTRIPPDRPPFPVPEGTQFFFTPQTHGAEVLRPDGSRSSVGARFILPNYAGWAPGVRKDLWTFSLRRHWYVYGQGTVNRAGDQIIPDPGVEFFRVPCAHPIGGDSFAPATTAVANGRKGADPVDLATGLFVMQKTDLVIPDVIPIVIRRSYRPGDIGAGVRPFGAGQSFDYQPMLLGEADFSRVDLVTGASERIRYLRTSPGTDFDSAVLEHAATPTAYAKSRLVANPARPGWDLRFKDGTVWEFLNGHPGAQLVAIQDRQGNRLTITRGLEVFNRRIQRIMSPSGRWVEFTWTGDAAIGFLVTEIRDHLGRRVSYTYETGADGYRRLSAVTDPAGGVTQYTYDASHQMLTVRDARGIVYLTNEYDAAGRIFRQTQVDTTTYQLAYTLDANGKIIQTDVTDPRGNVERTTFDPRGYPLTVTRAVGTAVAQTTTYQRDAATSQVLSVTDALNRRTDYTYDTLGNVLTVTRLAGTADAVTTTFTYEPTYQQVATVTVPLNHTTTFGYDAKGNLTTITNTLNQQTTLTYNAAGQPLTVTTPAGTTALGYELGDLASITDPTGKTTRRFTDPAGRLLSVTTPLGQRTRYEYDALNRLTKITDPLGGLTQFGYDPNGNLLSVTDARNNVTSYVYNTMDRLQTRTDPLLRPESYTYDNNGNLATFTDRKSQVTSRTYDALDRLSQVTYADTSTTTYTWDAGNRLTQVVDSVSGTITRSYDGLDRLTQEITPQGTVSYTYDAASRRTSMTVAGQPVVTYGYDSADRLTSITQGSTVVGFSYDTAGRRTSLTLPNNLITEYAYDGASRLTGLTYKNGSATLGTLTYGHDANGSRHQIGGTWARTGLPQPLASATYNAANHQLTFGSQTLTYDFNGNLTGDGANTFTWDARNRLTAISGPVPASFAYDGTGRRSAKIVGGSTTSFLYDGLNPVQENAGGGVTNLLAGLGPDEFLLRSDAGGARSLVADGLGSILAIVDSVGAVSTEYTYEPFGTTAATGASSPNELQFTGRENDGTGLYYYRARYYAPRNGRFLAEDPIGLLGGINQYAYAANNPIRFNDPSGLIPGVPEIPDGLDGVSPVLIAVVYAEATRQNYAAKAAVANVVKNRVQDRTHEFRRLQTYERVILQRNAFQAVGTDRFVFAQQVLSGRKPRGLTPSERQQLTGAFRAAQAVYHNRIGDTTGGALFFYSPFIPEPEYISEGLESGRLEQMFPAGVDPNDFLFFRYR